MKTHIFTPRIAIPLILAAMACIAPVFLYADPTDPFDRSNMRGPELGRLTQSLIDVIAIDVKPSITKVKRGEVVRLTITATPKKGYHAYPINQHTNKQSAPTTKIRYTGIEAAKPLWPIEESASELTVDVNGEIVFEHGKPFTWIQDILIEPNAQPGQQDLVVQIDRLQVCDEHRCIGPASYRPITIALEILNGDAVTPDKSTLDRLQGPPSPKVITPTAEEIAALKNKTPGINTPTNQQVDANNLWSFLWFASLSAFLMLLTPCVFPMIPITVNFFLKQSEKEHHNPLAMASVYSGTIIVLLTFIMLVLGKVVIDWANDPYFNLALGIVLIVFALSLFGMYEIELPRFLARFTSKHEGVGGVLGTFFMALTFTITSFTCTGPFLGLMLGSVAGVQPPLLNLVLGAVVYSTTFAAPFFVLALFPSLLKKIPKSGSWLNSVKVTMGFLELGAALKFLSNTDLSFHPGNPQFFNYDTVLAAWIALSVSCSLYLLGLFRLPHDDKVENIGVIRMLIAVSFLGLAVYLAPGLFGLQPAGIVGDNVVAFLPLRTGHENDTFSGKESGAAHKDWYLNYEDAWKDAVENNKLILIDFTATQCPNCRFNEKNIFPLPLVQEEMKKFVKVSLYTDNVPDKKLTKAKSEALASQYKMWQDHLGDVTLPYYVVLRPARDAFATPDDKLNGKVLGTASGRIFDSAEFARMLQKSQTTTSAQLSLPKK